MSKILRKKNDYETFIYTSNNTVKYTYNIRGQIEKSVTF